MDLKATAASLSEIERKALSELSNQDAAYEQVAQQTGLNIDSVRRAASLLSEKGLAAVTPVSSTKPILTKQGDEYLGKGLPEDRMLKALSGKERRFNELKEIAQLNEQEFSVALGLNKRMNFIIITRDGQESKVSLTEVGVDYSGKESDTFKGIKLVQNGKLPSNEIRSQLIARGLIEDKQSTSYKIKITGAGQEVLGLDEFTMERKYNVLAPVPEIYPGKKQPYVQFLNSIRRKLTELGFKEMEAPLIVHEFYNFDVLFQPQNHPARAWTDTYQLKNPQAGKISDRSKISAIKAAHETGGVSTSSGWQYTWLEEIAQKLMPTAHGTAHSARQLVKGIETPGKYFAIARCFRPDVLDATHLIEFNQTEGFIVGEDLNFTHLLGMLEQFAREIAGAQEVKFIPDYYPFTEPSVQLSAKHPKLGWVELGGAGMFRPEILENLGIKGQAIAWGIGIDRLAMFKLGIKDIRYLFSDDLNWLRKTPQVLE